MKQSILILVILTLCISCQREPKPEGTWLGAYQVHYSSDSATNSSINLLLEFAEDRVEVKSLDYYDLKQGDLTITQEFTMNKELFILGQDTYSVKFFSEDSMVLNYYNSYPRDLVFKKLKPKSTQPVPSLIHHAFKYSTPWFNDSIDFINDSTVLHIGSKFSINHRASKWTMYSHRSYHFLILDWVGSEVFLFDADNANEMRFIYHGKNKQTVRLIPIPVLKQKPMILGNWQCKPEDIGGCPFPPIPDSLLPSNDRNLYLKIESDSIFIRQYERTFSRAWELNTTAEYIYFPDKSFDTRNSVWKIVRVDNQEFIIGELNNHGCVDPVKITTFHRSQMAW